MHLGALIARLEDERDATRTIEALSDLVLHAEVAAAAEHFGESPGAYLSASVGQFASAAADEEWLALVAAMERADDPGRAAIVRILRWAMARDQTELAAQPSGCTCTT
ncbi:MAG: hypothetical protein AB7O57_14205 [Hyphomicrobiaceae bacterium]